MKHQYHSPWRKSSHKNKHKLMLANSCWGQELVKDLQPETCWHFVKKGQKLVLGTWCLQLRLSPWRNQENWKRILKGGRWFCRLHLLSGWPLHSSLEPPVAARTWRNGGWVFSDVLAGSHQFEWHAHELHVSASACSHCPEILPRAPVSINSFWLSKPFQHNVFRFILTSHHVSVRSVTLLFIGLAPRGKMDFFLSPK